MGTNTGKGMSIPQTILSQKLKNTNIFIYHNIKSKTTQSYLKSCPFFYFVSLNIKALCIHQASKFQKHV